MPLDALNEIRSFGPRGRTVGLPDDVIARFAERDPALVRAVEDAMVLHRRFRVELPDILELDEPGQVQAIRDGFVNFYPEPSVNPYVALAARARGSSRRRARCCTTRAATACSAWATPSTPCSKPWPGRR